MPHRPSQEFESLDFENSTTSLRLFLKNSNILLKNCQKFAQVRLSSSHKEAILSGTVSFSISLKNFEIVYLQVRLGKGLKANILNEKTFLRRIIENYRVEVPRNQENFLHCTEC
jgi:hypothetical protein